MAIPVILKGETPKPIPLALKEGYDYSGCCLHVEFCGLQDTFINLEAGGRVNLRYTAEQTAVLPLGTSKVMLSLENANGEVRFMPWAKIKVTDSPADLYDGVITIDPATLDVDDLTRSDAPDVVKSRVNAILAFLRGLKVLALALIPLGILADVTPKYAISDYVPGDMPIMTNVEEFVEAKMGLIPTPDFSTNNTELVETIHQTEVDPTVPAWAKKTVGDFYSYNLYSLVNRDFYAKDSSIKSQSSIWLKGSSNPTVTVGRDKLSDNTFPYSRQTVLGFSAYEGFDYCAHYRSRGIYIWPWWNANAEDYVAYLFPTNGNGGTFALTSEISTATNALGQAITAVEAKTPNNITRTATDATLVHAGGGSTTNLIYIRQASSSLAGLMTAADKVKLDGVGNYATVSNRAMSALQSYTETDPTISSWAKAQTKPTYTASEVGATTPEDVTAAIREQSLGGIWDETLQVWWTPRMRNGSLTYEATTNVNLNAEN